MLGEYFCNVSSQALVLETKLLITCYIGVLEESLFNFMIFDLVPDTELLNTLKFPGSQEYLLF